jgi:molybdate transport system substrate-binding protein
MGRALLTIFFLAALMGCPALPFAQTPTPQPSPTPAVITIYADAALSNVLRDIGTAFTQANPGVKMEWTFAEPNALRAKLAQGAPPHAIVSADAQLLQSIDGGKTKLAARDALAVFIAKKNPANIERIEDLNSENLRIAIAQENTALGKATQALIENFRTDAMFGPDFPQIFNDNIVAQLPDGRSVREAVLQNRADIGIIFASEVNEQAERVTVLGMPEGLNVYSDYMSVINTKTNSPQAQAFVEYLGSAQAQTLWHDYGFETK